MSADDIVDKREWRLVSALDAVEPVCEYLRSIMDTHGFAGYSFETELLLREAFTNAAEHGNGLSPEKTVVCGMTLKRTSIEICVEDEGEGFDWRKKRDIEKDAAELDESGRGVAMYRMFADDVEFNAAGNRVVLRKRLSGDSFEACRAVTMDREQDYADNRRVVCGEGDLTAPFSDGFRRSVEEIIEKGFDSAILALDLNRVKMLDSRGLAVIISLYKMLRSGGKALKLVGVVPSIYALLCKVNLDRHITIETRT